MTEAQKILTELINKFNLTKETLSAKMQVHSITITRWKNGETEPSFAELNYLKQVYNGYKSAKERED